MMPNTTTCRNTLPGTVIDYHVVSRSLQVMLQPGAVVGELANTWPHLPVNLSLLVKPREQWIRTIRQPRPLPKQPLPGCASFPWDWSGALGSILECASRDELAAGGADVLAGVEFKATACKHDGNLTVYVGRRDGLHEASSHIGQHDAVEGQ